MSESRRLAAIMFTDIQGYTRLMQQSEESAVKIRNHHRQIFEPVTAQFNGQVIQYYGDGTLSIFNSAVDAVRCAYELQMQFMQDPKIPVRIGIHMGDIILHQQDIIGDSVNIASRVESLGLPGSVLLSGKVAEEIKNKANLPTLLIGTFHFKNDEKPREVYALSKTGLEIPDPKEIEGKIEKNDSSQSRFPKLALRISGLLLVFLIALSIWYPSFLKDQDVKLAVLPLVNLSANAEQEGLTNGIHDAIISELQLAGVKVKPRSSMQPYRNSTKSVKEIARELKVDALIESNILFLQDSMQLGLKMVDGKSEEYKWRRNFQANFRNVTTLYHDIVQNIADEISMVLSPESQQRLKQHKPVNPEAYKAYLKGQSEWFKLTPAAINNARIYFEKSRDIDPNYAPAHAGLATIKVAQLQMGMVRPVDVLSSLENEITIAMQLDSNSYEVQYSQALAMWSLWEWKTCIKAFENAIKLNPNNPEAHAYFANVLIVFGQVERSLEEIEIALELDPLHPLSQWQYSMILNFSGQFDKVESILLSNLEHTPNDPVSLSTLKTTYHLKGMYDEAYQIWLKDYTYKKDTLSVNALQKGYRDGGYQMALQRLAEINIEYAKTNYVTPWRIATMYTRAGMKDEAIEYLEKAFYEHDANFPYINVDPIFDFMREDPRFQALIAKLNIPL